MKEKRVTTSKIVLFIPWVLSVVVLGLLVWAIMQDKAVTVVTALATIYTATVGISGYTNKWYAKKASLENLPKVRLGVIEETIKLAKEHPELKIYETAQVKADVQQVITPIKTDEQKAYEAMVGEEVGNKIT